MGLLGNITINDFVRKFESIADRIITGMGGTPPGSEPSEDATVDDVYNALTLDTAGHIRADLGRIYTAIEAVDTSVDLVETAVDLTTTAVGETTTAVGSVETAVALARTTLSTAPISMQAEFCSPFDFTATYGGSSTTITITGAPFSVDDANCTVISIMYKPTAGSWAKLTNGQNSVSITAAANVITVAGAGTPFASGDTYRITLSGQRKAFDPTTNSMMSSNLNPDSEKYVQDSLVDADNTAAATGYWPSSDGLSMDGYRAISFTGQILDADGDITLTIEATNDEDTATGDWIDVTKCFNNDEDAVATSIGASIATSSSATPVTFAISRTNFNYSSVRVKYVTSGATNTIHIKARRVF